MSNATATVVNEVPSEIIELEHVVEETNALTVGQDQMAQLATKLAPVVQSIKRYEGFAKSLTIRNEAEAKAADEIVAEITAASKEVEEAIEEHARVSEIHKLHRRWTTFRGKLFLDPLDAAKRAIKARRDAWTAAEAERIAEINRKLAAEAAEKARKEQEALEARAAKAEASGKVEKAEALREQASYVVPTVAQVAAPAARKGARAVWKVHSTDKTALLKAAAINPMLSGYLIVDERALERTKEANPAFACDGVKFHQVTI